MISRALSAGATLPLLLAVLSCTPSAWARSRTRVAATVADSTLRFGVLQLFQYPAPFGELLGSVILPQDAYNGVLAALAVALPPVRARA